MSTENSNDQKRVVAATRQVLMNELGLTRESVREQTRQIVEATVKQYLDNLLSGVVIENIVRKEMNDLLYRTVGNSSGYSTNSVGRIVADAVKEKATQIVNQQLSIKLDLLTPEVPKAITKGEPS